MKKIFIIILSLTLILTCNFALADSSSIRDADQSGKIMLSTGKSINKIFENHSGKTLNSVSKKNGNLKIKINKENEETAEVNMNGTFVKNGIECEVHSKGKATIYKSKKLGKLYLASLKGTILINNVKRDIRVSYEKTKNNEFYSITINDMSNEEGYLVISFGKSLLSSDILKEIGILDDKSRTIEKGLSNISSRSIYDLEDRDYEDLESSYSSGNTVLKSTLYLEDDLLDGHDGELLVNTQVNLDEVEDEVEDNSDHNVLTVAVDEFYIDFESNDKNSTFGGISPSESYSDNSVIDFIKDILGDLGAPSSLLSIVEHSMVNNHIDIDVDDELYHKTIEISPKADNFMDYKDYSDGGYPVKIHIEQDNNVNDDDIDIDSRASFVVYTNEHHRHFIVDTGSIDLDVDLANYEY